MNILIRRLGGNGTMSKSLSRNIARKTPMAVAVLVLLGAMVNAHAQNSQGNLQSQVAGQAPMGASVSGYPSVVAGNAGNTGRVATGPNGALYSPALPANPPVTVAPQAASAAKMPWDNGFGKTNQPVGASNTPAPQAGILSFNGQTPTSASVPTTAPQTQYQQPIQNGSSLGPPQLAVPAMPGMNDDQSSLPSDEQIYRAALEQSRLKSLGLTPDDIRSLNKEADLRARAAAENPATPPKPVTRTIDVSLQPGAVPEVIRLYANNSTSLVITDSTGSPWPVVNSDVGNKQAFKAIRLDNPQGGENGGETGGSVFSINALQPYAMSNFIIALKDCPTPVVLTLISGGQKEVDYRDTIRVMQRGPNAKISVVGMPAQFDSALSTVLDGKPPAGGTRLKVEGPMSNYTTAWYAGGQIIVRTDLHLISPAASNYAEAEDGTAVYQFAPTSSFTAFRDGQFLNLTVSGW